MYVKKNYQDPTRKPLTTVLSAIFGIISGIMGYQAGFGLLAWGGAYVAPIGLVFTVLFLRDRLLTKQKIELKNEPGLRHIALFYSLLGLGAYACMISFPLATPVLESAIMGLMTGVEGFIFAKLHLKVLRYIFFQKAEMSSSSYNAPSYRVVEHLLTNGFNDPEELGQCLAKEQQLFLLSQKPTTFNEQDALQDAATQPFCTRVDGYKEFIAQQKVS